MLNAKRQVRTASLPTTDGANRQPKTSPSSASGESRRSSAIPSEVTEIDWCYFPRPRPLRRRCRMRSRRRPGYGWFRRRDARKRILQYGWPRVRQEAAQREIVILSRFALHYCRRPQLGPSGNRRQACPSQVGRENRVAPLGSRHPWRRRCPTRSRRRGAHGRLRRRWRKKKSLQTGFEKSCRSAEDASPVCRAKAIAARLRPPIQAEAKHTQVTRAGQERGRCLYISFGRRNGTRKQEGLSLGTLNFCSVFPRTLG